MTNYHINKNTGRPNLCTATKRACPVGGDHFPTKEAAMQEIQAAAAEANNTFVSMKKSPTRSTPMRPKRKSREELFTTLMTVNTAWTTPDQLESEITGSLEQFADYENPGCGGCDGSGDDYCRCKRYTGTLSIDSKELATSFYQRYANERKYKTFRDLSDEEKNLVYEIEDTFKHHGITDESGYDVEAERGYYGEELQQVTAHLPRKFEELHQELVRIFDADEDDE